MATSKKQKELDAIKWEKSERLGMDACGTFDYCAKCDKNKENPCENAYNLTYSVVNEDSKNETKTTKKACTKTTKKTTEKKTTAKKTATKKSAKK